MDSAARTGPASVSRRHVCVPPCPAFCPSAPHCQFTLTPTPRGGAPPLWWHVEHSEDHGRLAVTVAWCPSMPIIPTHQAGGRSANNRARCVSGPPFGRETALRARERRRRRAAPPHHPPCRLPPIAAASRVCVAVLLLVGQPTRSRFFLELPVPSSVWSSPLIFTARRAYRLGAKAWWAVCIDHAVTTDRTWSSTPVRPTVECRRTAVHQVRVHRPSARLRARTSAA